MLVQVLRPALLGTVALAMATPALAHGHADAVIDQLLHEVHEMRERQAALEAEIERLRAARDIVVKDGPPVVPEPQIPANVVTGGVDDVELTLSGHVHRGIMLVDDGKETNVHHVDINTSSSRARLIGRAVSPAGWIVGTRFEWEWRINNSFSVDQTDRFLRTGRDEFAFRNRHGEVTFERGDFGKIWIGQGWKAAEAAAEADLSGTFIAGYSDIRTLGGGTFLRDSSVADPNDLNDPAVDPVAAMLGARPRMNQVMWNISSPRGTRVRYDTPRLHGFQLRASWIRQEQWDVALNYVEQWGRVQVDARAAFQRLSRDVGLVDFAGNQIGDSWQGSISLLDESGFNVTLGAGIADKAGVSDLKHYYAKLGYRADFWPDIGETALSVDFSQNEDQRFPGLRGRMWGAQVVQSIDPWGAEWHAGLRHFNFSHPVFDFKDMLVIHTGTRVFF